MNKRVLTAILTLALLLGTNFTQPIRAGTPKATAAPTATPTATATPKPTEKAKPTEVYCLVVAADFYNDGEKKLKEYFEYYKTSYEQYLGEVIIYEWHYFPKDKIPEVLYNSTVENFDYHSIYKACMTIFGQKYWQRVLLTYEMEGALIAPSSFGYDYGVDDYVDLVGLNAKQSGIHGECHVLESHVQTLNSTLNKSDPKNWWEDPNDKLKKFWLENGWCHYVVQKDVDRYAKQYGHAPIKWNDPKTKPAQADYKRDGKLVNVESEGAEGAFYAQNPKGVYWYNLCHEIGDEPCRIQHELEVMQRMQQEFGVTLVSVTPLHPKAKVPHPTPTAKPTP